MIARNPSLTDQVKANLKERIVDGEFAEGRIPAESDLAADLGVSRTTIRDALGRLEQEGAIYRRQGSGTFVNEPGLQIKSRLEEIWSYEKVLRDHGYTPSVRSLGVEREIASESLAAELAIEAGSELLVMEKLFLEDDVPVILTYNRIPVQHLNDGDLDTARDEPVYDFLETNSDRRLWPKSRSSAPGGASCASMRLSNSTAWLVPPASRKRPHRQGNEDSSEPSRAMSKPTARFVSSTWRSSRSIWATIRRI